MAAELAAIKQSLSELANAVAQQVTSNLMQEMEKEQTKQQRSFNTKWQQLSHSANASIQKETGKLDTRQRDLEYRQQIIEQRQRHQ